MNVKVLVLCSTYVKDDAVDGINHSLTLLVHVENGYKKTCLSQFCKDWKLNTRRQMCTHKKARNLTPLFHSLSNCFYYYL